MIAGINARRSDGAARPWLYFALVQILSIPFYWGELTPLRGFPFYGWPVSVAEIGWTGYATEPLQRRYGVIRAGLIIGGFWALWHVTMWWVGGGWEGQDHLVATVSQAVSIVLFRVVMGWIYANGGRSLFLAILIHAVDNTCWKLFPNDGSHYNPTAIAAVMVIVTIPIIMSVKARREAG